MKNIKQGNAAAIAKQLRCKLETRADYAQGLCTKFKLRHSRNYLRYLGR